MAEALHQAFCSFSILLDEIDDWCRVERPKGFPPRPKDARDLLILVAIHNLAAELGSAGLRRQIQALTFEQFDNAARDSAVRWN
ncbi:MAG TPA: hypothetical protein VFD58_10220 [Blastocatellia bacterium]|nr:hypothetical protein [Blastocatellia bacterium]